MQENETPEDEKPAKDPAAVEMGRRGGLRGGVARAEKLSPEQRSEIASMAARRRWDEAGTKDSLPRETHTGEIRIDDMTIECAVLNDGRRVLTQRGYSVALGRYKNPNRGSVAELPVFLQASNLTPFIPEELARSLEVIKFKRLKTGGLGGNIGLGYLAETVPAVCSVYLKAFAAGKTTERQRASVDAARVLLEGLARVGIVALVDEATGYQKFRDRDALQKILEKFVAKELRPWVRAFPQEFYEEMFRLKGWKSSDPKKLKRPGVVGTYTNQLIYEKLAPGVLKELKRKMPKTASGNPKGRLHSLLSVDHGVPELGMLLYATQAMMRGHDSWDRFKRQHDKSFPSYRNIELELDLEIEEDD